MQSPYTKKIAKSENAHEPFTARAIESITQETTTARLTEGFCYEQLPRLRLMIVYFSCL